MAQAVDCSFSTLLHPALRGAFACNGRSSSRDQHNRETQLTAGMVCGMCAYANCKLNGWSHMTQHGCRLTHGILADTLLPQTLGMSASIAGKLGPTALPPTLAC